jgi:hypothetical protein
MRVWRGIYLLAITLIFATPLFADAIPTGTAYMLTDNWGGQWWDTNKTLDNTNDDLLCWAAAASNVLKWTGWGDVTGMNTADDIWMYYQQHWSDLGGDVQYAWQWWFSGTNPGQGRSGWSQVVVPGGNFYSEYDIALSAYYHENYMPNTLMSSVEGYLRSGYGTVVDIFGGGAHAMTVWGINYDPDIPGQYYGIWVTDSDDDKKGNNPPARLRYYSLTHTGNYWYFNDFYGTSGVWYIGEVQALDRNPIPEPGTLALLSLGVVATLRRKK